MIATPIWPEFIVPILQVAADGASHRTRDLRSASFQRMGLGPEVLAEALPSGELRADNRAGWAITYIHRANWLERVSRGVYRITDEGRAALAEHEAEGFHDYAKASKVLDSFWETTDGSASAVAAEPVPEITTVLDPTEQIEQAVAQNDQAVAADLLDRLRTSDPTFFEKAVLQLLLAMGYGGSEQRGRHIGGSGDGGVDGVIDEDALGLDQVYVQAKRYAAGNNVGGEAIRAFIGALSLKAASRGVFITTSDFTPAARLDATSARSRIVLIDGQRLASLMIKYRVGTQVKETYHVMEVDEDFFE